MASSTSEAGDKRIVFPRHCTGQGSVGWKREWESDKGCRPDKLSPLAPGAPRLKGLAHMGGGEGVQHLPLLIRRRQVEALCTPAHRLIL